MDSVSYRKILVPVDGSKNSFRAVAHAGYLAACIGAEVGLLYVLLSYKDLQINAQVGNNPIPQQFFDSDRDYGQKVLEEAANCLPAEIKTHCFGEFGSPAEIIPIFAAKNNYDLIVIGNRGLGVIKELVMGSVSHYVLHHAQCPVLIIKKD